MSDEKIDEAIASAVSMVEKQYGKGSICKLGSAPPVAVESFSSGSLSLDLALGVGGYPRGRIVEIFGPEAGGKTTLALHAIAECQRAGGHCVFIDAEHALDLTYARALGVRTDDLYLSQPDYGEQALEIADLMISSGGFALCVVDSVAALTPKAEIEGEMGDHHVGLQARLMSQALRKLTATASRSRTTVIFINQLRHKIGVMFGSPETTTGGNALKFYASQRLDIRSSGKIKGPDNQVIGSNVRIRVVKNKVAPPFRETTLELIHGRGLARASELFDLAVQYGIVTKGGSFYTYGKEKLQGRARMVDYLSDPVIAKDLEKKVRAAMQPEQAAPAGKPSKE